MTDNLSVYWNTIKLFYEDKQTGEWIDFDSEESRYSYTVTYDQISNKLTFVLPDSLHIRIDYTTLITESGHVSVNNAVKVDGKASVTDIVDATFKVEQYSGGASGSMNEITLIKQDGDTDARLSDVQFHLYGPMGDDKATLPDGADRTIVSDSGKTLSYIASYTTGADGSVNIENQYLTIGGPYALVEVSPPDGYVPLQKPVYFYFYEPDPNGIIQTVTTLIAVENYTYGFVFPETGGTGTLPLAIIGFAMTAFPILYSTIRRKRERRHT
jgi:LPXTG-motif cell wall-anchored protein